MGSSVSVIVGIGVNLNTESFEEEITSVAVSVKQLTGRDTDIKAFAEKLREKLMAVYSRRPDMERYRELCVNVGRPVSFIRGGVKRSGVCTGVNGDFSLRVEYPDGSGDDLFYGEVTLGT